MKRTAATVIVLALVVAGCSLRKTAQPGGGIILGTVLDPSGAPLPGVTVTLHDAAKRVAVAVTDANGRYRFVATSAGVQTIQAELPGMVPATQRVRTASNESITVTTTLRLSSVAESITVSAHSPAMPPQAYVVEPVEISAPRAVGGQ